jgi:hypothetical protein
VSDRADAMDERERRRLARAESLFDDPYAGLVDDLEDEPMPHIYTKREKLHDDSHAFPFMVTVASAFTSGQLFAQGHPWIGAGVGTFSLLLMIGGIQYMRELQRKAL